MIQAGFGARSTGCCQQGSEAAINRRAGFWRPDLRAGRSLYRQAVHAARDPASYLELSVEDSLDGRFDMICLHVALLIRRLAARPGLAQAVFDAMFADMDAALREIGVSDVGLPRRIRSMTEAYHGRAVAYGDALARRDATQLSEALLRNIWRGRSDADLHARTLARWALSQDASLASQPDTALLLTPFAALAGEPS